MKTLDWMSELSSLLERLVDGKFVSEDWVRLNHLLSQGDQPRRFYHQYMRLHAALEWQISKRHGTHIAETWRSNTSAQQQSSLFYPQCTVPQATLFDGVCQGTVGYSSLGWTRAYLVATVLLTAMLVIGALVRISIWCPEHFANKTLPSRQIISSSEATTVGHISGLADCRGRQRSALNAQWSEIPYYQLELINSEFSVGDRFVLSSGLMEITYDTGAKVILEGPCTYEIESARGGYLAVGKLTVKVEKGAGTGGQKLGKTLHESDSHDPTSFGPWPLPPAPLFAVRTPTAIVTDLGTEFGVKVEESGATRSYVFQGKVELRENCRNRANSEVPVDILHAGESARVERGRNNKIIITREPGQPKQFVRRISKSPNQQISTSHSPFSDPRSLHPRYRLIDLGTFGGRTSHAMAINSAGQIVGNATDIDGVRRAFLHSNGEMRNFGALHDGDSGAVDINASGQVVGNMGADHVGGRVFLYSNGTMKVLGTLGGAWATASAINDDGMVVGSSLNSQGVRHAFLHTSDQGMKDLGALENVNAMSCALSVNSVGQVVGYSEIKNRRTHAFLYDPNTGMKDLGTFKGHHSSLAFDINDAGHVAGISAAAKGPYHVFLYDGNKGMKDLGKFKFNGQSYFMLAINNRGQIVGHAKGMVRGMPSTYAFLLHGGRLMALDSLVDSRDGWTNLNATAINDFGQIVGTGLAPDGNERAFLLMPTMGQGARN